MILLVEGRSNRSQRLRVRGDRIHASERNSNPMNRVTTNEESECRSICLDQAFAVGPSQLGLGQFGLKRVGDEVGQHRSDIVVSPGVLGCIHQSIASSFGGTTLGKEIGDLVVGQMPR